MIWYDRTIGVIVLIVRLTIPLVIIPFVFPGFVPINEKVTCVIKTWNS
jgi:hypothetical protein